MGTRGIHKVKVVAHRSGGRGAGEGGSFRYSLWKAGSRWTGDINIKDPVSQAAGRRRVGSHSNRPPTQQMELTRHQGNAPESPEPALPPPHWHDQGSPGCHGLARTWGGGVMWHRHFREQARVSWPPDWGPQEQSCK